MPTVYLAILPLPGWGLLHPQGHSLFGFNSQPTIASASWDREGRCRLPVLRGLIAEKGGRAEGKEVRSLEGKDEEEDAAWERRAPRTPGVLQDPALGNEE